MKCDECQLLIEEYVDGALDQRGAAVVNSHIGSCSQCATFFEEMSRERETYLRYQRDIEVTPALWSSIEARIKQQQATKPAGLISRLREQLSGVVAAPRLSPAFAAALIIVAIVLTVGLMTYFNSRGGRSVTAVNDSNTPATTSEGSKNATSTTPGSGPLKEPSAVATNEVPSGQVPAAVKAGGSRRHLTLTAQATPAQLVRDAEQKYLTAIAILSHDVNQHRSQLDPMVLARFDIA